MKKYFILISLIVFLFRINAQIDTNILSSRIFYVFNESGDSSISYIDTYSYDDNFHLIEKYTILLDSNRLLNLVLPPDEYSTKYSYDAMGRLLESVSANSQGIIMERELFTYSDTILNYLYQCNKNGHCMDSVRLVYYGIKEYRYSYFLDQITNTRIIPKNIHYYFCDSIYFDYTNVNNEFYTDRIAYFKYNDKDSISSFYIKRYENDNYLETFTFYYDDNKCNNVELSLRIYTEYTDTIEGVYATLAISYNYNNLLDETYLYPIVGVYSLKTCQKINHLYNENNQCTLSREIVSFDRGLNWINGETHCYSYKYLTKNNINAIQDNNIEIFPNPASNQLFLNNSDILIHDIFIYNIMGREIRRYSVNAPQKILDVSSLQPGMYFLKITTEHGILTRKVQVIR